MNHQVLSGDLMRDSPPASRFRNDDPGVDRGQTMDYRHVPLMDDDDHKIDETVAPFARQNLVV